MGRIQAAFSLGRNSVIGRSVRTRLGGVLGPQGHFVHVGRSRIRYQRRPHNLGLAQNLNLHERLWHRVGWLQIGAAVGCRGLLAHSFIDFNLHIPANAAWFAVGAAIAAAGGRAVVSS